MATEHFSDEELCCKHCGECHMDEDFLILLEEIRVACGFPLFVTSGYRCPEYNTFVSNTGPYGPHTTGRAVDIMISGKNAFVLVSIALELGIRGVGVKQKGSFAGRFIHLDAMYSDVRPRIWSY